MQNATQTGLTVTETIAKCLALREDGAKLIASYERALRLVNPSAKVLSLMQVVRARIDENAREYLALRDSLPIQ